MKGLIFKEGENQTTDDQGKTPSAPTTPAGQGNPQNFSSTQTVQGIVDNKFIDVLTSVIEENNQPGQDYFEFKQAVENMNSLSMPEQQKFQTVYSVLGLQGCTKEGLLLSLDKYVQLIQKEKEHFDAEMDSQFQSKVQVKRDEVEAAKNELTDLTKRIQELNSRILTLQQEAGSEEMGLRATEANFQASADVVVNEMLGDKQKITTFIQ